MAKRLCLDALLILSPGIPLTCSAEACPSACQVKSPCPLSSLPTYPPSSLLPWTHRWSTLPPVTCPRPEWLRRATCTVRGSSRGQLIGPGRLPGKGGGSLPLLQWGGRMGERV